jgi:protein gp37
MAARNLPEMRSPTTGEPFAVMRESGPRWTGRVELIPSKLDEPLRWRKPRRVFVNSMSDLFHEALPDEAIDRVFGAMICAPWHTFQVLTKRPARMRDYLSKTRGPENVLTRILSTGREMPKPKGWRAPEGSPWPYRNVWLGVSVEDQATADERIPLLLQTPAAVRFISYEPALGGLDIAGFLTPWCWRESDGHTDRGPCAPTRLDWVIVGGESGPGARPFDVAWARSVVAQCKAAGVAAFYKQGGASNRCAHSAKGGHFECFPQDLKVREFPR